jgi:UrcA family protein
MKTLLAIAAAAVAFGAAPAPARDSAPVPAQIRIVRYADLDLATQAGRSALDRRLAFAVREVCGSASDADLHGKNVVRRCLAQTARAASARRDAALASTAAARSVRLASGR